jgi:hypothetical protein
VIDIVSADFPCHVKMLKILRAENGPQLGVGYDWTPVQVLDVLEHPYLDQIIPWVSGNH